MVAFPAGTMVWIASGVTDALYKPKRLLEPRPIFGIQGHFRADLLWHAYRKPTVILTEFVNAAGKGMGRQLVWP